MAKGSRTSDRRRYQQYLDSELVAAAMYRALAGAERDPGRAAVFRSLVEVEMRHAAKWAGKLGVDPASLKIGAGGFKGLLLRIGARVLGTRRVLPVLLRLEAEEMAIYAADPEAQDVVEEERSHSAALQRMSSASPSWNSLVSKGWHVLGDDGNLRAAVLGMNDGLVSNFSLIMGVAGGIDNADIILLAGVAGLLAGAFSMATGEYVSVGSQRELYQHQLRLEAMELELHPEEEEEELVLIYQAKGLTPEEAARVAKRVMASPAVALDTMAREELGLDPSKLGSPWGASISSFAAFVAGAVVPLVPYIFGGGDVALSLSAGLSGLALLVVGGALAALMGRNALWGASRMLLVGAAAAAVTFGIGNAIGVSLQ